MPDDGHSIGPTGVHEFGEPLTEGDRGQLMARFLVNEKDKLAAFCFGTRVDAFGMSANEARDMAGRIRTAVHEVFGDIEYPHDIEFPIRFDILETEIAGPRVMIHLPTTSTAIVGSAVFWYIYCDRLEAEAAKIRMN